MCSRNRKTHFTFKRFRASSVFFSFSRTCILFISYLIYYEILAYPYKLYDPRQQSSLDLISNVQQHVLFYCSVVSHSVIQWTAACWLPCPSPSHSLLKLMSIELTMPSRHLILCCSLLLLPSIFPNIRVVSNELTLCIRWLKYWSFSLSTSPFNEYSGLISFRIDWFALLTVQRALIKQSVWHTVNV